MIQKEVLHGGRRGKISKEEDKVIRPGNKWTSHVQSFLSFMHENGFNNIPKPYGINESGMEMVSFVDGTVYNDSLPNEILRACSKSPGALDGPEFFRPARKKAQEYWMYSEHV